MGACARLTAGDVQEALEAAQAGRHGRLKSGDEFLLLARLREPRNVTAAARLAGVSRTTMHRRLRERTFQAVLRRARAFLFQEGLFDILGHDLAYYAGQARLRQAGEVG